MLSRYRSDEVVIDDNDEEDDEDQIVPYITEATLLPQPSYVKNRTYLTIHVHKIGIKDPHNYIEPSIRIFVKGNKTLELYTSFHKIMLWCVLRDSQIRKRNT